jgi:hypothetical protein
LILLSAYQFGRIVWEMKQKEDAETAQQESTEKKINKNEITSS